MQKSQVIIDVCLLKLPHVSSHEFTVKPFIHVMIDPSFYFLFLSQFIVFVFSFSNSCFILPKILKSQRCNTERQQNIIIFFAWQMTNNWSVIDYQFLLTNVLINCVYINVCLLASFCDRGAGAG